MNVPLFSIALVYNLLNVLFLYQMETAQGGAGLGFVYIFPLLWLSNLILIIFLTHLKKKEWLSNEMKFLTVLMLIFNTPIPFLIIYVLLYS